jgi:Flp pilus assembly protein TadG
MGNDNRQSKIETPQRPRGTGEKGQALIEFALLFPFAAVLVFLIFDTAMALDRREVLDHALREGTRTATLGSSVAVIQDTTASASEGILDPSDVAVCYEDIDGNGQARDLGDAVRVSIDYQHDLVLGGELLTVFGVSDPSISMGVTAHGRLENDIQVAPSC